jgi:allantoinase
MPMQSPLTWPQGARIAVLPQLIFEAWVGNHAETRTIPKIPEEHLQAGVIDHNVNAWAAYGAEIGARRVFDLFRRYGLRATGIFSGAAVERFPEFCRRWVDAGNEIAAHSYAQDIRIFPLGEDEERANARRCVDAMVQVTGQRPVGWNCPAGQRSEATTRILLEEGFYYSYDYKDDDRPHTAEVIDGRRMAAVPKLFDINDVTNYSLAAHPPSVYVESFCRSFDILYEEGATAGKMLSLSAHAAMYGRPFGVSALDECIRYARSFPGVWFATGKEVADWWFQQEDAMSAGVPA